MGNINLSSLIKLYFVPIVIFMLSFCLIFLVLIPQVSSAPDKNSTIEDSKSKIETLNNTLNTLNSISDKNLIQEVELSNTVLPGTKDIVAIYNAMIVASIKSSVNINRLSIVPGVVYNKDKSSSPTNSTSTDLGLELQISGASNRDMARFIDEVQKVLPLHDVASVGMGGNEGSYRVVSFYRPSDIKALSEDQIFVPITQQEKDLLKLLNEEWISQSTTESTLSASLSAF